MACWSGTAPLFFMPDAVGLIQLQHRPERHGFQHLSGLVGDLEPLPVNGFIGDQLFRQHFARCFSRVQDGVFEGWKVQPFKVDIMGRAAYAAFMNAAVISVCALCMVAALCRLRARATA